MIFYVPLTFYISALYYVDIYIFLSNKGLKIKKNKNKKKLSMYFHNFVIISLWKNKGPFIWTNLNFLHPNIICAKFGWNWPSGSGEDNFSNLSIYFHYFIIISPWNKRPMGHIADLRKQLKSINTYDYIITLIKGRKKHY